jgi:ABC transport system ATP-binding/permease protein
MFGSSGDRIVAILVSCQSIGKSYSSRPLFQNISFGIEDEQKIGLIGPNGAGKSTLMKILSGEIQPDEGAVVARKNLRVAYVQQSESFDPELTVEKIIEQAADLAPFEDYHKAANVDSTLTQMGFPDRQVKSSSLSGGWRKRLALACALVQEPDLLLLDEPTNHLDLEGVLWLEKLLKSISITFVVVSHDRAFLEGVANKMIELNPTYPEGSLSINGNYSEFLIAREERLNAQLHQQQALASKVRREIAWLQRGARARQTKAKGRIEDAGKLIEDLAEVKQRNALNAPIEIGFDSSGRKTKELITAKGISKRFAEKILFSNVNMLLTTGTKLGLVGRNGSGKTTLLKLLVGELQTDVGTIKRADQLQIVWFDQNREQLDETKTLKQALSSDGDTVLYRGRNMHVTTWAKKFLFRPDQLPMPISYLSGGEKARILIANLMLQPADVLILDEPTNDLDIGSLEVLEDSLEDFPGAVILVTHDRMMLDTVSSQILALDGTGEARYFADYEQCEKHLQRSAKVEKKAQSADRKSNKNNPKDRVGLTTAEKRELSSMADQIEQSEAKIRTMQAEMEKPQVASNYPKLNELSKNVEAAQEALAQLFKRWEELEAKAVYDKEPSVTA